MYGQFSACSGQSCPRFALAFVLSKIQTNFACDWESKSKVSKYCVSAIHSDRQPPQTLANIKPKYSRVDLQRNVKDDQEEMNGTVDVQLTPNVPTVDNDCIRRKSGHHGEVTGSRAKPNNLFEWFPIKVVRSWPCALRVLLGGYYAAYVCSLHV